MAYDPKNLSVLAHANEFTLWHYTTPDTVAVAGSPGYFNIAAEMVRVGDMILANIDINAFPSASIFLVKENKRGVVKVADIGNGNSNNA